MQETQAQAAINAAVVFALAIGIVLICWSIFG